MTFGSSKPSKHPTLVKLNEKLSPVDTFTKILEHHDYVYILESVEGPRKLAEYSFIGFNPSLILKVKDGKAEVHDKIRGGKTVFEVEDPLPTVRRIVGKLAAAPASFRFLGGAVGYISYDAVRYWERLPNLASDDLGFPDIEMAIFTDGVIFDHKMGKAFYYYIEENHSAELLNVVDDECEVEPLQCSEPNVSMAKEDFEKIVVRAKGYIAAGDIFQVVLSKRYGFKFHGSLIPFYRVLRKINPSPYMYFLKMGKRQIVGSSPEMLVRVEKGWVETFPIAGTRPHVKDAAVNRTLRRELLMDPKERAEHVMLVDLARNDVGKVSEFGTVSVPEFMKVYQYSHVQHIVSRVTGKLRSECDCYDALRAVFPAGTVSGAPKVRAMEIIEECEPVRRGPYAGAVGYFSFNGNADFAITIRTLVAYEDYAYIQAGAGIVADSDPEKEWFETEHKAEALLKALKLAEEDETP
ncbi:MAG: anthranilate synthase component I [Nitrososphaerota archaeon]|nr:anthranilate synthase component I [Nitrososphaerota archaeon]